MSQPDARDADIAALRNAGEVGDSNACQDATRRLLLRIPAPRALELTQQQVAARWPLVERHQSGVMWPLRFVEDATAIGRRDAWVWPADDDFAGPGANNFIRAVDHLWESSRILNDDEKRVTALVDSIANAIMAERLENWGARHLEQWSRWYQEMMSGERRGRTKDCREKWYSGPKA